MKQMKYEALIFGGKRSILSFAAITTAVFPIISDVWMFTVSTCLEINNAAYKKIINISDIRI